MNTQMQMDMGQGADQSSAAAGGGGASDPTPAGHEFIGTFNAVASYTAANTNMDITNITNGPVADGDMLYNTVTEEYVFLNDIHEGSGTIIFTMTRAQLGSTAAAIEAAHLWNFYRPV